jgi:hypothetical protein
MSTENLTDVLLNLCSAIPTTQQTVPNKEGINIKKHDGKCFINKQ